MIEISFWKILVVLVVALIVLGPEQLPKAARTMGRLLNQVRNLLTGLQNQVDSISDQKESESQKDLDKK